MTKDYIPVAVLALLAGCHARSAINEPGRLEVEHVFYYRWSGMSPGGGFTFTSLTAVEVDLRARRTRGFAARTRHPEAMLPYKRDEIESRLSALPWKDLSDQETQQLEALLTAWLQTKPPGTYNVPQAIGIEDGLSEAMQVRISSREYVTLVNPRGGFIMSDPLRPPEQWHELVAFLLRF